MIIEGRLKDLYEAPVTSGSFIRVCLVIETPMTLYYKPKDVYYKKDNALMMFEYLTPNYLKKGQEVNEDDFYIRLIELKIESEKHDNFIVEVDYDISCKAKKDESGYWQNLKINNVRGKPAPIDNLDDSQNHVDEPDGFPSQDGGGDLPFVWFIPFLLTAGLNFLI